MITAGEDAIKTDDTHFMGTKDGKQDGRIEERIKIGINKKNLEEMEDKNKDGT